MKQFISLLLLLLLLAGCASPNKSSYQAMTATDVSAKMKRNRDSRDHTWNRWAYAGSDQQYDYIYEYNPGIAFPYGFRCYKLEAGQLDSLDLKGNRYPFNPAFGNNREIF